MMGEPTGELMMLQVVPTSGGAGPVLHQNIEKEAEQLHPEIVALLDQFADVFKPLSKLPPVRPGIDHKIPLKEGTEAINLRPYKYSVSQKDAIEELTKELLEQGVIQNCNNPFASPIVLVKKKDG